jgi:hypothetical protein
MAETPTLDATPDQPAGLDAGLDAAIAELGAQIDAAQTPAADAGTPSTDQQAATTEQPAADAAPESGGHEEPIDERPESPEEESRPTSRMGRLRQQLTQAEQKARDIEAQLQQRLAREGNALRQFVDLVLPDAQYRQLEIQARNGDWEAKQKLDLADHWRRMAAPIADIAHLAARQQFDTALEDLRTLDGMDGDTHQKLVTAATPGDKLKLAWQSAFKAAEANKQEEIQALKAEIQALKTNRAATGSQPANGGSPQQISGSGLAGLIDPSTGLLTDEAERLSPSEIRARFGSAA